MTFLFSRLFLLTVLLALPLSAEDLEGGIGKLSLSLSEGIARSSTKKVAVIDFTDLDGHPSELGRFIAEDLSIAMVNSSKGFSVMDRANMRKVLDELKLAGNGLFDPAKAKEAGHMAGVDAIVLGTLTQFGESLIVTAKVISTESTEVLAASKVSIVRTKEIESMLKPEAISAPRSAATLTEPPPAPPLPEKDFTAPNAEVVSGNIAFEIKSFKKSAQGIEALIRVTNQNKKSPIRIGLNVTGSWDGPIIGASVSDEESGNTLPFARASGLSFSKSNYGGDPNTYASLRKFSAEVEKWGDKSTSRSALIQELNSMTEIDVGQSTEFSLSFSSRSRNLGRSFRLAAEVIVAEIVEENQIVRVTMKNVSIPRIQPK